MNITSEGDDLKMNDGNWEYLHKASLDFEKNQKRRYNEYYQARNLVEAGKITLQEFFKIVNQIK